MSSEVEIANAQGSGCMVAKATVYQIYVYENEELFFDISDPWYMDLYLYDDDAVTYPLVWGGDAEYLDDFRIEGNYARDLENIGGFHDGELRAINISTEITLPQGSGLNIFFQGTERDDPIFDGVGIVSVRHPPSENYIGSHMKWPGGEIDSDSSYDIHYRIDCKNYRPLAKAGVPYIGIRGVPVPFDGSHSNDPDGNIITYDWDFGDSTFGSGIRPTHAYDQAGTYEVVLKITDGYNATSTSSTTATIQPEVSTDFAITCQQNIVHVFGGGDASQNTCSVTSLNGFGDTVDLSCETPNSPGVTCNFSPSQVTPQANGTVNSIMAVSADGDTTLGPHDLIIKGNSGGKTFTLIIRLDVSPV